jgi:acetolactate decarboxylase
MVVLDGVCYQVSPTGATAPVEGERLIPYAVVTQFSSSFRKKHQRIHTFDDLVQVCDQLRDSSNVFYAFRVNGSFHAVKTRVMKSVPKRNGAENSRVRSAGISIQGVAWNPGGNMVAGVRGIV